MLLNLKGLHIINDEDFDFMKSWGDHGGSKITRNQAKAKHKDLPDGGVWRTIRGHHVYIKDGKVVAGAFAGKSTTRKASKKHLNLYQEHVNKEAKKKEPAKKKTTASKKKTTASKTKTTTTNNKTTTASASKKKAPAKNKTTTASKTTKKTSTSSKKGQTTADFPNAKWREKKLRGHLKGQSVQVAKVGNTYKVADNDGNIIGSNPSEFKAVKNATKPWHDKIVSEQNKKKRAKANANADKTSEESEWARKKLPVIGADYKGLHPDVAKEVNKTMPKLFDKFPFMKGHLWIGSHTANVEQKVNVERSALGAIMSGESEIGKNYGALAYSYKGSDGEYRKEAPHVLVFNDRGTVLNKGIDRANDKCAGMNKFGFFHGDKFEDVITHEFGHAFQNAMDFPEDYGMTASYDMDNKDYKELRRISNMFEEGLFGYDYERNLIDNDPRYKKANAEWESAIEKMHNAKTAKEEKKLEKQADKLGTAFFNTERLIKQELEDNNTTKVSDYGETSPSEHFAELFSAYMKGTNTPYVKAFGKEIEKATKIMKKYMNKGAKKK